MVNKLQAPKYQGGLGDPIDMEAIKEWYGLILNKRCNRWSYNRGVDDICEAIRLNSGRRTGDITGRDLKLCYEKLVICTDEYGIFKKNKKRRNGITLPRQFGPKLFKVIEMVALQMQDR